MKRAIGDRAEEGKTLSHLGLLHWEMGDYKQSTDYYNQAIAIAQQLQDRVIEASVRNNLGLVLDEIGNYRRFGRNRKLSAVPRTIQSRA